MAKSMILTAEQALNTYKGKSLSDLSKAANELTKIEGDASIMRRVIAICYWAGVACKAKKLNAKATEATVKDTYLNFASGWYVKGMGGKREPLEKGTLDAYVSAAQGFGLLGTTSWNSQAAMLAVMHATNKKGQPLPLTAQAGKARKFAAMEAAPNAKLINETIKGDGKSRDAGGRKAPAILASMATAIETIAIDAKVIEFAKGNKVIASNLKDLFAAAAGVREALADLVTGSDAKTTKQEYRTFAKVSLKAAATVGKMH